MKMTFGQFEHTCIGFPKVILKWMEENGKVTLAYVTVHGVVKDDWKWHNQHPIPFIQDECKRFDDWVRKMFANNASVQG